MSRYRAGLGCAKAKLHVYIANRPPLDQYRDLTGLQPMAPDEIRQIADLTGNHWRKIFNVYAKLVFSLNDRGFASWQLLRDQTLLQNGSETALWFDPPEVFVLDKQQQDTDTQDKQRQGTGALDKRRHDTQAIHIVCGKQYAQSLNLPLLTWVNEHLAYSQRHRLLVTPYFDYRQLSNIKLAQLVDIIQSL